MFKFLLSIFKPKIKIYACKEDVKWVKVVSYKKPKPIYSWYLRGPFRSEVDCEEFCDEANSPTSKSYAKIYQYENDI